METKTKITEFKGIANTLPINVYKWSLGDCTNGGISSRHNELLLVGLVDQKTKEFTPLDNGFIEINFNSTEDMERDDLCVVVKRELWGEQHDYICGLKDFMSGKWCMSGGNFGYSCDSRYRDINQQPLPIHDRIES